MTALFKKLNYKDQKEITILNAPDSFTDEMSQMKSICAVHDNLESDRSISFLLFFVTEQQQIDQSAVKISEKSIPDVVLWFVYPKKTSKKYKCLINRDTGWSILGRLGWEGVRMVAVDSDWSAFRFRRVEFIKSMTRSFAISSEGKKKSLKK